MFTVAGSGRLSTGSGVALEMREASKKKTRPLGRVQGIPVLVELIGIEPTTS